MSGNWKVAVLGATGLVGEMLLTLLDERKFPVQEIFPLASDRSAGKSVTFKGRAVPVLDAAQFDFSRVQLGFFFRRWRRLGNLCAEGGGGRLRRHRQHLAVSLRARHSAGRA